MADIYRPRKTPLKKERRKKKLKGKKGKKKFAIKSNKEKIENNTLNNTVDPVEPIVQPQDETPMNVSQDTKTAEELINIAGEMWLKVKELAKSDPEFVDKKDSEKLKIFRDQLNYEKFMTEYPITCRYMICMGQYSKKAFKRFLEKTRLANKNHPPPTERPKGYMEDQWVRRQADYVRFLWESYQKGHWNTQEAQYVWEDSYKKLKGEFDDFRDKYDDIKEAREKEKDTLKASNARDLLERLKSGTQKLDDSDSSELYYLLKNQLYKKRYSDCVNQIKETIKPKKYTCSGTGKGPEEDNTPKPVIQMIEHVDNELYDKIPAKYKMSEAEAKKYAVLQTIPE